MRIITLIENSPGIDSYRYEHGLSVYIETDHHKILADTGASNGFLHNAALLGVDLGTVDTVFLSHGHYDHAGGILAFSEVNQTADIYMMRTAPLDYFALDPNGPKYIGIDKHIKSLPNLHLLDEDFTLDSEISMISGITGRRCWSKSNLALKRRDGSQFVQDTFDHEQALVVQENGKYLLFSGCAHSGILNILDRFREIHRRDPDIVISGFHFMKDGEYTEEEWMDIENTARELTAMNTVFYTGHCTGKPAFNRMKPIMGEKLRPLHSGLVISN